MGLSVLLCFADDSGIVAQFRGKSGLGAGGPPISVGTIATSSSNWRGGRAEPESTDLYDGSLQFQFECEMLSRPQEAYWCSPARGCTV